jgi:ATP-binding cassette subfamily F protein uup
VSEGDRIGLIGPNGSGKSTLLEDSFRGRMDRIAATVAIRKRTSFSLCRADFGVCAGGNHPIRGRGALEEAAVPDSERLSRIAETLGRAGFTDFETDRGAVGRLAQTPGDCAGWRRRPTSSCSTSPPTIWISLGSSGWKPFCKTRQFACVVVSHDRYFLENVASEVVELNRVYEDGYLRVQGNYSTFLEAKEEYLHAQGKRQDALANRVHTEMEWLRRGPQGAHHQIQSAHRQSARNDQELAAMNARTATATARIDFSASNRQTKRLIGLSGVTTPSATAPYLKT